MAMAVAEAEAISDARAVWNLSKTQDCPNTTKNNFLNAVRIWCVKPHVANRRLCGSEELWSIDLQPSHRPEYNDVLVFEFIRTICRRFFAAGAEEDLNLVVELLKETLLECWSSTDRQTLDKLMCQECKSVENGTDLCSHAQSVVDGSDGRTNERGAANCVGCVEKYLDADLNILTVSLRYLIPKQSNKCSKILEVTFLDSGKAQVIFLPVACVGGGTINPCLVIGGDGVKGFECSELIYRIDYSAQTETNGGENRVSLFTLVPPPSPSRPAFPSGEAVGTGSQGCRCSEAWLGDTLLRKVAAWACEVALNTQVTSLRLVSVQRYAELYAELKLKYGQQLVQIWTESTDPQKFVYEDIGIATYLMVLWEEERRERGLNRKQSFVDLGCGNGLLVYLLTKEGHSGIGLDVRRRQTWDYLGKDAVLKEFSITPSDSTLFPDYDWLIGNHSDELTPWIPVIAARSHYDCRYLVLPCCAWDFSAKFAAKGGGTSQYQSYLEYCALVGRQCGFVVERDVLRIPSTKRTCFVGKTRSYSTDDESRVDFLRTAFIKSRCKSTETPNTFGATKDTTLDDNDEPVRKKPCDLTSACEVNSCIKDIHNTDESMSSKVTSSSVWADGFKPRDTVEGSTHPSLLTRQMRDMVVMTTFRRLIDGPVARRVELFDGRTWRLGESVSLAVVSEMFGSETLGLMRKESGGLQTLLKNCADVFTIREGCVSLRDWTSPDYADYQRSRHKKRGTDATQRHKTKPCFHFEHHPDSCPLSAEACRFAHGTSDLRTGGGVA